MSNIKISELTELTIADDADEIAIVDDDAGTTKKITRGNLLSGLIISTPSSGQYKITNIRLDSDKKIVITYNETPEA